MHDVTHCSKKPVETDNRIFRAFKESKSVFKYESDLTYSEFFEHLKNDPDFVLAFNEQLKESDYEAFFFETPKVFTVCIMPRLKREFNLKFCCLYYGNTFADSNRFDIGRKTVKNFLFLVPDSEFCPFSCIY